MEDVVTRDFICLMCPNGCHLKLSGSRDGRTVGVEGNRCEKGLTFVRHALAGQGRGQGARIASAGTRRIPSRATLKTLAAFWGVSFSRVRPDLLPAGSPERTLFRTVIEDRKEKLFVLEEIPPRSFPIKMRIIRTLEYLAGRGMRGIVPYLAGCDGGHVQECGGGLWQLVPFVRGVALDREAYLHETWRAEALARFLNELRDKSRGLPFFAAEEFFSIKAYIFALVRQIERHRPEIVPRVRQVVGFLERGFMEIHDGLPVGFCHGDYHPLNVVWGAKDLTVVIDWEFAGMKPEIYDVANMVGCLGMERPSSLVGGLAVSFVRAMKGAGAFAEASWKHLPEFVVALRFAWLSEWLRRDDTEMIALELDYMDLLIEHQRRLRGLWL
ncbi:MAG TPA: phosphotransferase [Syntrophales bacterium]|nr:phosphotransferase [Syntrophales bacterium]